MYSDPANPASTPSAQQAAPGSPASAAGKGTGSPEPSFSSNPKSQIQNPKSASPDIPHPTSNYPTVTTAYPNLPQGCELPTDACLLAAVAACDTPPALLAEQLGIRLDLLLDWMTAPHTVRRLNALIEATDLVELRKQKLESDRILASLASAHDRAVKAEDHVEQRRAAVAYLRFANRPQSRRGHFGCAVGAGSAGGGGAGGREGGGRDTLGTVNSGLRLSRFPAQYRSRARFVRTVPVLHEPPAVLAPPTVPNPVNSPAQTTIALLQRLQDSDNPNDGDGLRTLFNHFTPEWRSKVGVQTADEFACTNLDAYHQLLGHHSAVLWPTEHASLDDEDEFPRTATQHANLIDLDGDPRLLKFVFRRKSAKDPWLIDDIALDPASCDPSPPNSS